MKPVLRRSGVLLPYVLLVVLLEGTALILLPRLGLHHTATERTMTAICQGITLASGLGVLVDEVWHRAVQAAEATFAPLVDHYAPRPRGARAVILALRYHRESEAAREVYTTLIQDAGRSGDKVDFKKLLAAASRLGETKRSLFPRRIPGRVASLPWEMGPAWLRMAKSWGTLAALCFLVVSVTLPWGYKAGLPHAWQHGTVESTSSYTSGTVVKLDSGAYATVDSVHAKAGQKILVYRSTGSLQGDRSRGNSIFVAVLTSLGGLAGGAGLYVLLRMGIGWLVRRTTSAESRTASYDW